MENTSSIVFQKRGKKLQKAIMGMEKSIMLCAIPVNHTSSRHVSGQPGWQQAAHETEQELMNCMACQIKSQAGVSALRWPEAGSWRGRKESTAKQEEPAARLLLSVKLERGAAGETHSGIYCFHQGNDDCAIEETLSLHSLWDGECCKIKTHFLPLLPKCTDWWASLSSTSQRKPDCSGHSVNRTQTVIPCSSNRKYIENQNTL